LVVLNWPPYRSQSGCDWLAGGDVKIVPPLAP